MPNLAELERGDLAKLLGEANEPCERFIAKLRRRHDVSDSELRALAERVSAHIDSLVERYFPAD